MLFGVDREQSLAGKKLISEAVKARLHVEFADRRTAKAVHEALLPDNHDFPKGMLFKQELRGSKIAITIEQKKPRFDTTNSLYTLISTLDEFVAHIYSVTQTLEKIESLHDRHKDSERKS